MHIYYFFPFKFLSTVTKTFELSLICILIYFFSEIEIMQSNALLLKKKGRRHE